MTLSHSPQFHCLQDEPVDFDIDQCRLYNLWNRQALSLYPLAEAEYEVQMSPEFLNVFPMNNWYMAFI